MEAKVVVLEPRIGWTKEVLADGDGAQVELLCLGVLLHVVVVERGQVADGEGHLIVRDTKLRFLDGDCLQVHLFRELEHLGGLVEPAEVAILLGGLHVGFPKTLPRQAESKLVQLLRLHQQPLLHGNVGTVNGDLKRESRKYHISKYPPLPGLRQALSYWNQAADV